MAAPKAPQDPVSSFLTNILDKKKSDSKPVTEQQRVGKAMSDYDTEASNVGAGDSENDTTGQRNIDNAGKNPRSMKALMDLKKAQKQAGDTPSPYKKGGMVKKAGGGSVRGSGCAAKGRGKGTMY
jgi:hypothetical protein